MTAYGEDRVCRPGGGGLGHGGSGIPQWKEGMPASQLDGELRHFTGAQVTLCPFGATGDQTAARRQLRQRDLGEAEYGLRHLESELPRRRSHALLNNKCYDSFPHREALFQADDFDRTE